MSIDKIRMLVRQDFDAVNTLIIDKIQPHIGLIDELSHHIVQSGGKRLRPLLVLLASHACGYQGKAHILLAAVIEFIHTATLLHDDVLDESTLRRGRKTANSIWGNKASILVGDYLFTQSMQLSIDVGKVDIIKIIADVSMEIIGGEVKQLSHQNNPHLNLEEYFEIIRAKTALLFAAAAKVGAHISEVDNRLAEDLFSYGLHLGNAFQLIDDVLDYCSDPEILGKNIGDDLRDGKATLPLIHAFKHGSIAQQENIKTSLLKGSLDYLPEILSAIQDTKAIEYTKSIAANEVDKAIASLHSLKDSEYKTALKDLAQFALLRDY